MARNLSVIPDLQVSAYMLSAPTPPAVHILPDNVAFDKAMHSGLNELTMMVQLFVAMMSDLGSQVLLDRYLSPSGTLSVKAALEADLTLGGACQVLHVLTWTYRQYPRPEGESFLGADFTVQVYT